MLGGLDPVIIFQFSALAPVIGTAVESIPIISAIPTLIDQPPIPVYLSERAFNIALGGVSKSVDIQTTTDGKTETGVDINQNPIQASVEINIEGKQDSIALTLLSALIDQIYERVTSKEYSITFLYGSTTVFRGLLQSYSSSTIEGTDKLAIQIKLTKGEKTPVKALDVITVPGASSPGIPVGA